MAINVLIVDDSAVVREILTQVLSSARDINVTAAVPDPIFAMQRMKIKWPDVIVLDIEMPRMDGLTFLRQIMAERPTPIVICSSLTDKGANITLDAMSAGAVSIVTKPTLNLKAFLEGSGNDLIQEVRAAAMARMGAVRSKAANGATTPFTPGPKLTADAILEAPSGKAMFRTTDKLIAIGTSTGGTQALEFILPKLPTHCPAVVVVQHMPEKFTTSFAERLNRLSKVEVLEAKTGDRLLPGVVLIAPGGRHLLVKRSGAQYIAEVKDGPLVSRHRPSVDVLFRSVAVSAGSNALGVIMTGMGDDGARGMREMYDAGARTLAQDEESCVVFGMPKEAIAHGGVSEVISLTHITQTLASLRG
ncbi:chemotaxis response regulator protein-glutamate methylesterase [Iodobacter sp. LRB]|uniref:protein-glutamate methylesterase/protein-glutamine glutaminase n=1 Tax=unclassified Iodobacter TaxID=235634 RepID=UPI000C0F745A|nr:chemotaxis response regulator protein-glutamate methylesterase [Iodobacter sp. BJB302]PHV03548.1 chemotaxis response regulator protein-glutamate methylesterase [Iodobacter sp. BJB302]